MIIALILFSILELMDCLNLPTYQVNVKSEGEKKYIFDRVRKKYVALTPEEWVRQHFINYLISEKQFPESLISVELAFGVNKTKKRSDIVAFNRFGNPIMIVECKASSVKIDQSVFDQIARYNMKFKVPYLVVTNGINHYCCKLNIEAHTYAFMEIIPDYQKIND